MRRLAFAMMLAAWPGPASAETLSGTAEAIDGDTLKIGGREVRLFGIDAPEFQQTCDHNGEVWACGEEATRQLQAFVATGAVDCSGIENDQNGRLLAVCWSGRYEINANLVAYGWAMAQREFSDAYVAGEARARAGRLGIWSSSFETPQTWRLAQEVAREQPAAAGTRAPGASNRRVIGTEGAYAGQCAIKGNRNRKGEWIYHLPGMPYYDATRPEEIFCTEAQARAAGYRRAIVR